MFRSRLAACLVLGGLGLVSGCQSSYLCCEREPLLSRIGLRPRLTPTAVDAGVPVSAEPPVVAGPGSCPTCAPGMNGALGMGVSQGPILTEPPTAVVPGPGVPPMPPGRMTTPPIPSLPPGNGTAPPPENAIPGPGPLTPAPMPDITPVPKDGSATPVPAPPSSRRRSP
jgi:hypothetical protein